MGHHGFGHLGHGFSRHGFGVDCYMIHVDEFRGARLAARLQDARQGF